MRRESSDRVVALSAGFIGLAALAISGYQAYIMREQQRASVWPRIEVLLNNSATSFRVSMTNPGIGPALIQGAEVTVDGKAHHNWPQVLAALGVPGAFGQGKIVDRALSPNQTQDVFMPEDPASIKLLGEHGERVHVSICYCSIYKDCWEAERTLKGGARMSHREVGDCDTDPERLFTQ